MAELNRMSVTLHIPSNVKEQAALIYRKALKADLIRGRSIDAFVAAAVYAACRAAAVPRPIKKVSEVSSRDHAEVARTYRLLIRELKIRMPVDEPMKFVPSIAAKLKLRRDTEQRAINILHSAKIRQELPARTHVDSRRPPYTWHASQRRQTNPKGNRPSGGDHRGHAQKQAPRPRDPPSLGLDPPNR